MSRRAQNSKVKKRNRPRLFLETLESRLAPSISAIESTQFSGVVASVTDPDPPAPLSAWTASINWGDGSPVSAGTITQPGGTGTNLVVSGSHTYSDEGSFQVTATVKESGSTAMATAQVSAAVSEADVLTAPSLSTSLVSLWKAEGNANDSAGGNNGTLQSGATFAPGKFGQAFSFDGVNSYVQAGTTGLPTGNSDRTLALWVNIAAFGTGESWFAGYGNFGTNNQVYSMGVNPTTHTLFFSSWGPGIAGPALQTGTWYYVTVTNVGNLATLYLNGTAAASGNVPITTPTGTNFYMGRIPGSLGDIRKLNGLVDEVAIFNRALSTVEIQAAMNDNFTGPAAPSFQAKEGQQFSGTVASFTDANTSTLPSDFAVTINWGDGSTSQGTVTGSGGSYVVKGSHTYAEQGSYSYSVQVQDDGSGTAALSISGTATVADAPLAFVANATLPSGVEGQSVSGQLGTFVDGNIFPPPGPPPNEFTATIDWGDGATSTGTIALHPGPIPALAVGPNVNMSKESGNQNECSLAINPTNPNNIVAWSNDESAINGGVNEYVSNDGGATWTRQLIGAGDNLEGFACCDTQSIFDSFGNLYAVNIDFGAGFTLESIKVLESFDGGNTFQVVTIQSDASFGLDQPSIAFGDGMVWVSYKDNSNGAIKAAGATVTGLGQISAFSTPEAAPGSSIGSFGNVAVSPTGQVVVCYESPSGGAGPATILANIDPDGLGPQGFGPAITVTPTNVGGFAPIPPQPNRTVDSEANVYFDRSGGPHNGRAYLVYTDCPSVGSQHTDIFVRISDNNGATWSNPIRVTDDNTGNSHFNPQMAIDPTTGNVAIAWYDSRNAGPADQTAQVFATVSTDGGVTWMPNVQVSAGTSNVTLANSGIDYGDYMLMDFYGGTFRPIWSDNSNSTGDNADGTLSSLDIYTAAVTFTNGVGFDVSGSHTYKDEGNYSIKVQLTDTGGSTAATNSHAHVVDAALTPSAITLNPTEQTSFTGRVGSFTDSNAFAKVGDFTASIDWGDGHTSNGTVVANNSGGFDVVGSNTYSEESSFQVKVSVRDVGGSTTNMTSTAVVVDAPLTPMGVNLTAIEAATLSGQVGLFQDAFARAPLSDFTTGGGGATINWGDGSRVVTGAVTQPGGQGTGFAVSGSHFYKDAGSYTVTVTLHDKGGSSATAMSTVTVMDAPLSALGIALRLTEGSPFTGQVAAFVDANSQATLAAFTTGGGSVTIDWGDGSPVTPAFVTQPQGLATAFVVSGSHTYTEERSYTIHVLVTDHGGATSQSLASALVLDAGLMASGVTVNAFDGTAYSGPVATFVDANPFAGLGDFSSGQGYVRIDWGDGFTSLGTVSQPGGQGTTFVASGTHTYAQVGTRQIQVNIYDVGGSPASATSTVTIADAPIRLSTGPLTMTEAVTFSGAVGTFTDLGSSASLADFTTGTGGATI
ncbi:MAG TPA: LamG-like jellyroll fold domain-containing protein, partial [Gemmataceae bacterium]|nr:LamG-like jellyroll fold domain-containing protein [Gemmataceae bacterium]